MHHVRIVQWPEAAHGACTCARQPRQNCYCSMIPLRNVDAKLRFEMRLELPRLLQEQRRASVVLLVTQDYKEAMALGDQRIAVLSDAAEGGATLAQVWLTAGYLPARPATSVTVARAVRRPRQSICYDMEPRRASAQGQRQQSMSGCSCRPAPSSTISDSSHAGAASASSAYSRIRPEFVRFCGADAHPVPCAGRRWKPETPLNEKIVTLVLTRERYVRLLVSRPASDTAGPP